MTKHKLALYSILTTLPLAFSIVPAFANTTWNNNDPNVTWITDPMNDVANDGVQPSKGKDILKVGMDNDSVNNQYVFRMYLNGIVPNMTDVGTIYNIYFGATPSPTGQNSDYVTYSFSWDSIRGKYSKASATDLDSLAFSQPDNKTLEWKANKNEITGSILYFMGATTDSTGQLTGTHPYDITATPIPAAAWLFGSGIVGLIGIRRRTQERFTDETQRRA